MVYCSNCGTPVQGNYCKNCGHRIGRRQDFQVPPFEIPQIPAPIGTAPQQMPQQDYHKYHQPQQPEKHQHKTNLKVYLGILIVIIVIIVISALIFVDSTPSNNDEYSVTIKNKTNNETRIYIQENRETVAFVLLAAGESKNIGGDFKEGVKLHIFNPDNFEQDKTFTVGNKDILFEVYNEEILVYEL
jgi:hypothetical protein